MFWASEVLDRTDIIQDFVDLPTPHGAQFDDGRRWCGKCMTPVLTCEAVVGNGWADKICKHCTAIWPEYADLYQLWVMMEHDEDDDFGAVVYMN